MKYNAVYDYVKNTVLRYISIVKKTAKIMITTMADLIAGSNSMDILNIAAPPSANPFRWPSQGLVRRILFNYVNQLRKQYIH